MADTLEIVIAARDQFSATANKIVGSLGRMESAASRVGRVASTAMVGGLTLASTAIILNARAGVAALEQLEDANAQTAAAIESTGMAAGLTAGDIRRMSESFEDMNALFDDKVVQAGANVLLTFTNIRKEAFEPTMQAALDLSVRMKQDLGTSVLQLGKALNDPVKGLTALRRVGVQFTDQQEEQIKALVRDNDLLGAQRVILDELNKEFGGSFLAQGQTSRAKLAKLGDAIEDLQATLAEGLLPAVVSVADALKTALGDPKVKADVKALGEAIGSVLTPANVQSLVSAAGTVAELVKSAVQLFNTLPPDLQKLALAAFAVNKITGGAITSLAGLALSSLKTIMAGQVTVIGGNVTGGAGAGVPGVPGVPAATGAAASGITVPRIGAAAVLPMNTINDMAKRDLGFTLGESIENFTKGQDALKFALVSPLQDTENLLRANLTRPQAPPQVTVINNVSAREITNVVKSSSSYGTTSSSYYGGSPAPALSH